jgi:hypothetical protein
MYTTGTRDGTESIAVANALHRRVIGYLAVITVHTILKHIGLSDVDT